MAKTKKVVNKKKKSIEIPELRIKCKKCKTVMGFHLHMCERGGVSEFCGCKDCDDYCTRCKGFDSLKN